MDQNDLEKRIKILEEWKKERERQQIVYPLDDQSIKVLNQNFMRLSNTIIYDTSTGNTFTLYTGNQGDYQFYVSKDTFVRYTVDTSSEYITLATTTRISFVDDAQVLFYTSDTYPNPLVSGVTYYIINSTSNGQVFQVSASSGGAAVNFTTAGVGEQYITYE